MTNIQSIKQMPIKTVSATIELVPLTLYGQGSNDLAKVTVNIQLVDPLQEETKFLIPSEDFKSQKVYLPDGSKVELADFDPATAADIDALKPSISNAVNEFLIQPLEDSMKNIVSLMANYLEYKNASKVVSIPAGIKYVTLEYTKSLISENGENLLVTNLPLPDFSLVNQQGSKASLIVLMPLEITDQNKILESTWTPPNGAATSLEKTSVAGRIALTGYWQYDPIIRIKYKY